MEIEGNVAKLKRGERRRLDLEAEVLVSEVDKRIRQLWPDSLPPAMIQDIMPQILRHEIELQESLK